MVMSVMQRHTAWRECPRDFKYIYGHAGHLELSLPVASTSMREEVVRYFVDCDLEKLEKGFDDLSKKNMIGKRFLSEPEILSRLGQSLFRHRGAEIFIPAHHQVQKSLLPRQVLL